MSTPNLADWLLARVAEDEAVAKDPGRYGKDEQWHTLACGLNTYNVTPCDCGVPARVLAQCAAVRAVVALHKSWPVLVEQQPTLEQTDISDINAVAFRMSKQIQWLTEQEYRNKFGAEPPTSPILRALATVYAEHEGYRAEWAT